MQRYLETTLTTRNGVVVLLVGATVTVRLAGTNTLATLYSDNLLTPQSNPFVVSDSELSFYAADGRYDVTVQRSTGVEVVLDVLLQDGLPNLASLQTLATSAGANSLALGGPVYVYPSPGTALPGIQVEQIGPASGAFSAYPTHYNTFYVNGDNRSLTGAGFIGDALYVGYLFGGSNMQGARQALQADAVLTAPTNAANANRNYVGAQFQGLAISGDGGTNLTTDARGGIFGANHIAIAYPGATNLFEVSGGEVNVEIQTGASAKHKFGWKIIQLSLDTVQGTFADSAIVMSNQGGAVGWKAGFDFNGSYAAPPLAATGVAIRTTGAQTMDSFIDASSATITNKFLKSSNFSVAGSGDVSFDTAINNTQKGIFWKAAADSDHGSIYRESAVNGSLLIDAQVSAQIKLGSINANGVVIAGALTLAGGTLLSTSAALTNGAAAAAGTLSNAPVAGNPTKWISINDNGTIRRIPAW